MQFGMYLYKQGTITAEQLLAAVEHQSAQMLPLGVIAMEEGKLAVRDVLSVLRVQSDLPNDRFGEIAIELGLMTKRDVAELLMIQSDRRVPIGECLVALGILSADEVAESLAAFRRERERGGASHVQRVVQHFPDDVKQQVPELVALA